MTPRRVSVANRYTQGAALEVHQVRWQNQDFQIRIKTFTGWTAQIIQHEIDHCEGVII